MAAFKANGILAATEVRWSSFLELTSGVQNLNGCLANDYDDAKDTEDTRDCDMKKRPRWTTGSLLFNGPPLSSMAYRGCWPLCLAHSGPLSELVFGILILLDIKMFIFIILVIYLFGLRLPFCEGV